MKRSVIWGVLALVIAVFSVSLPGDVQAAKSQAPRVAFDGTFVPAPNSGAAVVRGGAKILSDATIQVSIAGATPNTTYSVWAGALYPLTGYEIWWVPAAGGGQLYLATDAKGNGTATGWLAVFEQGQGYPYVVVGLSTDAGVTYEYVTGIIVVGATLSE